MSPKLHHKGQSSIPDGVVVLSPTVISHEEKLVAVLRTAIGLCGIVVMLFAGGVLITYGREVYETHDLTVLGKTDMAPGTAACLFCVGVAFICSSLLWRTRDHGR